MFAHVKQLATDAAIIARNFLEVERPLAKLPIERSSHTSDQKRVLIIASDPDAPQGSMGEMAMLSGIMQAHRAQHPNMEFTIIGTRDHSISIPEVGRVPVIAAWLGRAGTIAFHHALTESDAIIGLGADVLDGKYGAALVCRFSSYLNHAARNGIPAAIAGFSFNATPRRPANYALSRLSSAVQVNLRDEYSLQRFLASTKRHATLCADAAFLMKPSTSVPTRFSGTINQWREENLTPVIVNLNAHAFSVLLHKKSEAEIVTAIAKQLASAAMAQRLGYVLLPHDTKPQSGDIRMLKNLEIELRALGIQNVEYVMLEEPSEIKAIAGLVDFVITGRMHLAIASLGVGTPVLSITYQDKFEGLYKHFEITEDYLIAPEACIDADLSIRIGKLLSHIENYREGISNLQGRVRALATRNILELEHGDD